MRAPLAFLVSGKSSALYHAFRLRPAVQGTAGFLSQNKFAHSRQFDARIRAWSSPSPRLRAVDGASAPNRVRLRPAAHLPPLPGSHSGDSAAPPRRPNPAPSDGARAQRASAAHAEAATVPRCGHARGEHWPPAQRHRLGEGVLGHPGHRTWVRQGPRGVRRRIRAIDELLAAVARGRSRQPVPGRPRGRALGAENAARALPWAGAASCARWGAAILPVRRWPAIGPGANPAIPFKSARSRCCAPRPCTTGLWKELRVLTWLPSGPIQRSVEGLISVWPPHPSAFPRQAYRTTVLRGHG